MKPQRAPIDGEYIHLTEVQRRLGLSRRTVIRRVGLGVIPVFDDLIDGRRRLVAVNDLPLLTEPYPVTRDEGGRQLQPA